MLNFRLLHQIILTINYLGSNPDSFKTFVTVHKEQTFKTQTFDMFFDGGHRRRGPPDPVPISEVKAGAVVGDVRCASPRQAH